MTECVSSELVSQGAEYLMRVHIHIDRSQTATFTRSDIRIIEGIEIARLHAVFIGKVGIKVLAPVSQSYDGHSGYVFWHWLPDVR